MAEIQLESEHVLPKKVAEYLAQDISNSIHQNGHCFCALSGGSSPKAMLNELALQPLDWSNVTLLMVDERFTTELSDQNETMLLAFIDQIAGEKPKLISLLNEKTLTASISAANSVVQSIPGPLDIVVLGMGLDGHTASLFPDSTDYQTAMTTSDRYVKVVPGAAPYPRISMSFHWLLLARKLVLYIPGKDKLKCYRNLIADPNVVTPIKSLTSQANTLVVFSSEES